VFHEPENHLCLPQLLLRVTVQEPVGLGQPQLYSQLILGKSP